jgi:hypothetical protein
MSQKSENRNVESGVRNQKPGAKELGTWNQIARTGFGSQEPVFRNKEPMEKSWKQGTRS